MFLVLKVFKVSGKFIIVVFSNIVIFLLGYDLYQENFMDDFFCSQFDVFVLLVYVGFCKFDLKIYQYVLEKVNEFVKVNVGMVRGQVGGWLLGVKINEIMFLDDIGENLKVVKQVGFQIIKVLLGRVYEVVEELEKVIGLLLDGGYFKIFIKLNFKGSKVRFQNI